MNQRPKRLRTKTKSFGDYVDSNVISHLNLHSKKDNNDGQQMISKRKKSKIPQCTEMDSTGDDLDQKKVTKSGNKKSKPPLKNRVQSRRQSRINISKDDNNDFEISNTLKQTKRKSTSRDRSSSRRRRIVVTSENEDDESDFEMYRINLKNSKINTPTSSGIKLTRRKTIVNSINESEKNSPLKKSKKIKGNKKKENNSKRYTSVEKIKTQKQALEESLIRLHSSSVPETLPSREYHFDDIYNFISRKLLENEGGCIYISGVPGTGKTATLHEVKRKLFQQRSDLPAFQFIEINALKLAQPNRFFSHFLMELEGIKKNPYQATNILSERFSNMQLQKDFIILFIDELDYLKTKKQNILYHIFDWPNKKNSKLIVLAVANSMDLPERFLVNRVSSRLGLTRLIFQPYSYKELEKIVLSRLSDLNGFVIFDSDALELICRKVSAVSGDARRVLDICRRSIEICIADGHEKVNMKDVDKALKEIFNSIKIQRIMKASIQEQIFLRACLQNLRSSGLEEYQFIEIYKIHADICRLEGHFIPNTVELSKIATNLDLSKIILLEKSKSHIYRRIRLNVSPDDISFALNLE